MSVLNMARTWGLALLAVLLVASAAGSDATGVREVRAPLAAGNLEIILQLDSVDVGVSEPGTWLPIDLTNIFQDVGGFEISLLLDRPDLLQFSGDSVVETTIVCVDTIDCDPADTTIDTIAVSQLNLDGSAILDWEFVQGRALSPINMKIAALANQAGNSVPPLAPSGTPRRLLQVFVEKVAPNDVLDTLTDRTTRIFIDRSATSFSTPDGFTIGRFDSTICWGAPPPCDSVDTVYYTDSSAFLFVNGARTFVGSCVRGDVNESGAINSSDIIYMVNFVFKGGPPPTCSPTAGDVNCSGSSNSSDIIYLVNFVFKGGPPPATSC